MLYQRFQKNSKTCCSNMLKSINAEDWQLHHHKRRKGKDTSTLHQFYNSEEGKRRHKRSKRVMNVLEGKSDKNVFHSLDYRVPKETSGGKTRAYTIPETSAVWDCEDERPECPVAVSEGEVNTRSAIHQFCKDQSISDVSMTLKDILEKATSIPGTPSICNDLKEQEENIILTLSSAISTW